MKHEKNINRRKFLKMSAAGAGTACAAALLLNSGKLLNTTDGKIPQDAKREFAKCGACSHTFFHLLGTFGNKLLNIIGTYQFGLCSGLST